MKGHSLSDAGQCEPSEFDGEPTKPAAKKLGIQPQTMRAGFCRDGHYMGMRPTKLPNGRLLWPSNSIKRLLAGEVI